MSPGSSTHSSSGWKRARIFKVETGNTRRNHVARNLPAPPAIPDQEHVVESA